MTEPDSKLLQPDYSDPERYRRLSSGAVQDKGSGKIVAMDPDRNPWRITELTAGEMSKKSITARRIRHLRGLARGAGYELPEDADLETIVNAAGDAWEALIAHTYRTYMKSNNLRGMGDVLLKLGNPFMLEDEQETPKLPAQFVLLIAELARRREKPPEVIDADDG